MYIEEYHGTTVEFQDCVPKKIAKRTVRYKNDYNLCLSDAFEDAVKELAKEGSELWKAWYYSDYRKFLPQVYEEKYLDFTKYPLAYEGR